MSSEESQVDAGEIELNRAEPLDLPGSPSGFVCPDCGGALWEQQRGTLLNLQCHVGHTFLPENFLDQQAEAIEQMLWATLRSLKDRAKLLRHLATQARQQNNQLIAQSYEEKVQQSLQRAEQIRQVLFMSEISSTLETNEIDEV